MSTVQVEYVGAKPIKQDNVAHTGTTWMGQGDVQSVPTNAWPLLARHPDVWRLAGDGHVAVVSTPAPAPRQAPQALPPPPAPQPPDSEIGIYGTNHPPEIHVGGQLLQLDDVVTAALAASGLTIDEWNALEDGDRFDFVEAHIATLRAEDANRRETAVATTSATSSLAPAPAPAPAPASAAKGRRKAAADSAPQEPVKRGKRGG